MGVFFNFDDFGLMQLRYQKGLIIEKVFLILIDGLKNKGYFSYWGFIVIYWIRTTYT